MDKLPIYKLVLTDTGIQYVAFVNDPAIGENFIAFSNQNKIQFKATDSEQRIVSGPLLIADQMIFRHDDTHGDHMVYFDAATIKETMLHFFQNNKTASVNLNHNDQVTPDDIFMFESFLIDSKRGINTPAGFDPLPDGSWFVSYKVNNDAVWTNFVQTGKVKGFSIEGLFGYEINQDNEIQDLQAIIKELEKFIEPN